LINQIIAEVYEATSFLDGISHYRYSERKHRWIFGSFTTPYDVLRLCSSIEWGTTGSLGWSLRRDWGETYYSWLWLDRM